MNKIYVAFVQTLDGRIRLLNAAPEITDAREWVKAHSVGTNFEYDVSADFWIHRSSGAIIKIRPCPITGINQPL